MEARRAPRGRRHRQPELRGLARPQRRRLRRPGGQERRRAGVRLHHRGHPGEGERPHLRPSLHPRGPGDQRGL